VAVAGEEMELVACTMDERELTSTLPAPITDTSVGDAKPDVRVGLEETSPGGIVVSVGTALESVVAVGSAPEESVAVATSGLVLEESDDPVGAGELLLSDEAGAWVQLWTSWNSCCPATVIGVRVTVQVSVMGPDDPWIVFTVTIVTGEPP